MWVSVSLVTATNKCGGLSLAGLVRETGIVEVTPMRTNPCARARGPPPLYVAV